MSREAGPLVAPTAFVRLRPDTDAPLTVAQGERLRGLLLSFPMSEAQADVYVRRMMLEPTPPAPIP